MEVTDYENDINNIRFQQLLKKTTIRQPVKEISEKTKTDKGQVSKILNNKIPVSDKFLEKFLKA
jgi:transcriptional regulator with XRE-family HTH domain